MPAMMAAANDRRRPSVDSVYNLLSGLDDNQAEDLLRDLNHTTPSNIPISEGIDFFEHPEAAMAASAASWRRTTFVKAVSTFDLRSCSTPERASRAPSSALPHDDDDDDDVPPLPSPRARSASAVHHSEEEEALRQRRDHQYKTPRAYKRISRPWATLAPPSSGGPDVRDLLMAYLSDSPSFSSSSSSCSSSSSSADSPATPRSAAGSLFSPMIVAPSEDAEADTPGLADLLEPSPSRTKPRFAVPSRHPALQPCYGGAGGDSISGIFEVLSGGS